MHYLRMELFYMRWSNDSRYLLYLCTQDVKQQLTASIAGRMHMDRFCSYTSLSSGLHSILQHSDDTKKDADHKQNDRTLTSNRGGEHLSAPGVGAEASASGA